MAAITIGKPIDLEWGKRIIKEARERLGIPPQHIVEDVVITFSKYGVPHITITAIPVEEK